MGRLINDLPSSISLSWISGKRKRLYRNVDIIESHKTEAFCQNRNDVQKKAYCNNNLNLKAKTVCSDSFNKLYEPKFGDT